MLRRDRCRRICNILQYITLKCVTNKADANKVTESEKWNQLHGLHRKEENGNRGLGDKNFQMNIHLYQYAYVVLFVQELEKTKYATIWLVVVAVLFSYMLLLCKTYTAAAFWSAGLCLLWISSVAWLFFILEFFALLRPRKNCILKTHHLFTAHATLYSVWILSMVTAAIDTRASTAYE